MLHFLVYSLTVAFCQWTLTLLNLQIQTSSHCLQTIRFPKLMNHFDYIKLFGLAQKFHHEMLLILTLVGCYPRLGLLKARRARMTSTSVTKRSLQCPLLKVQKKVMMRRSINLTVKADLKCGQQQARILEMTTRKLADQNEWSRENHSLRKHLQPPLIYI